MPTCTIVRRAAFAASHRYWLPDLSEEQNQSLFGACAQFPGHGHNYELFVSMTGAIDATGMVLNLSEVKHVIAREVVAPLNFSFLNQAWPEFQQRLPTTEHIAYAIWHRLIPFLPLTNIRLFENPELWADYQGVAMQAHLTLRTHFSAAHRLALPRLSQEENTAIYGKCARIHGHGHNYLLEVTIAGEMDERTGMVADLGAFEGALHSHVLEPLDHTFLNLDIPYFADVVPTAENIAVYIQGVLTEPIRAIGARLHCVKLVESPNNSCEVYGESELVLPEWRQQEAALA
jgi:6-pyruvoyltetrahydropterin/6-carboxytetrahydropterin synthase